MRLRLLILLAACRSDPDAKTDTDPAELPDTDLTETEPPVGPVQVRFATFNVSMFRSFEGGLLDRLRGDDAQARSAAAILQEIRPDVILLNEFDWDADGASAALFLADYVGVGQDGREPVAYPHWWAPTVNTGVPSGLDLDNDGSVGTIVGTEAYGNDAFGFGEFPGQYGMLVLSRFPIRTDEIRTFQHFLWADVPGALLPDDPATDAPADWYSPAELDVLRLSSKTHADVPIDVNGVTVHLLVSHPTPPSFDGADDHNGHRNHDEIRLWVDYLAGGPESWHVDDAGVQGALTDESFMLAGDLNNDPVDGDGMGSVITALLAHPRVGDVAPASEGAVEASAIQGGINDEHEGDPALDTTDFADTSPGNLRLDYLLPSADLDVVATGVFWPLMDDPLFPLVGTYPFPVSDHRLVWLDVEVGGTP